MGRDWNWNASRSSNRGNGRENKHNPSGCMSSFFQFFDFHHFQIPVHHQHHQHNFNPTSFLHRNPIISKSIEVPRNSLESENDEEQDLHIPMGVIQIKTSGGKTSKEDISSEISSSPCTKTPNLVARLMGLDLLPETNTPRSVSSPHYSHQPLQIIRPKNCMESHGTGTRSLPETPRMSAARRSDVEHRFSLQINKENINGDEFELPRISLLKKRELKLEDENRSPRHYAKQIVKQVKESLGRKVGLDITNSVKNRDDHQSKKSHQICTKMAADESNSGKFSPRLRFLEPKNKCYPAPAPAPENVSLKLKKAAAEKRGREVKKPLQKLEESYVRKSNVTKANIPDKKIKKIPLSNDLPSVFPVKKDPSPPETKIPQKQLWEVQDRKRSSQLSKSKIYTNFGQHSSDDDRVMKGIEFQYVVRILSRTGIKNHSPVSFSRWFSPSHPLDPSLFHNLEHFYRTTTSGAGAGDTVISHRSNRKLIFELVDEILVEILKPYVNMKPWTHPTSRRGNNFSHMLLGSQLVDTLWSKIGSYPMADCRVLEDIDAIIGKDLPKFKVQNDIAYEEEGEGIVNEIERDILNTLVNEVTLAFGMETGSETTSFNGEI